MNNLTKLVVVLFMVVGFQTHASDVEISGPDTDGWGLDIGTGVGSYTKSTMRFAVNTPYLFEFRIFKYQLDLSYEARKFMGVPGANIPDEFVKDISLTLQQEFPLFRDGAIQYSRLGLGMRLSDNQFYDGSHMIIPFTVGFNLLTAITDLRLISWFFEYTILFPVGYEAGKSLPAQSTLSLDKDVQFMGNLVFGVRMHF